MSSALYWLDRDHADAHGCYGQDCDVFVEIPPGVVAEELAATMRRNPATVYCRRRGCSHRGSLHEAAGCMVDGCECTELKQ